MGKTKVVLGALAGLLVVALAIVALVALRAGAALDARDETYAKELAAFRAELAAARRPVLVGAAIEGNAAPRYTALLASAKQGGLRDALEAAGADAARDAGPWAPLPDEARALLAAHAAALDAARLATRHDRCDPELAYELGPAAPLPELLPALAVGTLLVLDGHARSAEPAAAADAYLVAYRFGADMAPGSLVGAVVAARLAARALEALGALVASGPPLPKELLAHLDERLARAESILPSVPDALRAERFGTGTSAGLAGAGLPEAPATKLPLVQRVLVADLLATYARHHDRVIEAWKLPTRAERQAAADAAQAEVLGSWNPLVQVLAIDLTRFWWKLEEPRARLALTRVAIAAERGAAEPPLPEDPLAPGAPLRFERTATGWRAWSRGEDGVDQGGAADDLVLARVAP